MKRAKDWKERECDRDTGAIVERSVIPSDSASACIYTLVSFGVINLNIICVVFSPSVVHVSISTFLRAILSGSMQASFILVDSYLRLDDCNRFVCGARAHHSS